MIHRFLSLIVSLAFLFSFHIASAASANDDGFPEIQVSEQLPLDGKLDRLHKAKDGSHLENSIYALRNTVIEDLLKTRIALKTLLGGIHRTERLVEHSKAHAVRNLRGHFKHKELFSYSVPENLGTLFYEGNGDDFEEIKTAAQWLEQVEPKLDETLRNQLLVYLSSVSALLIKLDRHARFIAEDFWKNEKISDEFFDTEIRSVWRKEAEKQKTKSQKNFVELYEAKKKEWLKNHGMDQVLGTLEGEKERILSSHRILALEFNGKPLYRHIYIAMMNEGFPSPEFLQKPLSETLPHGTNEIPLPVSFDETVEEKLTELSKGLVNDSGLPKSPETFDVSDKISRISEKVGLKIDQALLISLAANTEALSRYTSELHYKHSKKSALYELAKYDGIWRAAKEKYQYLSALIDFDLAYDVFKKEFKKSARNRKLIRNVALGTGLGLGVAAFALSGPKGKAIIGANGWKYLAVAGSTIGLVESTYAYADSKTAKRVAKGLFEGTSQFGSYADLKNAILINQHDWHMLMFSLALTAYNLKFVIPFETIGKTVNHAGQNFVAVSKQTGASIAQAVPNAVAKLESMGPFTANMVKTLKTIVQVPTQKVILPFSQAVAEAAKDIGISSAQAMERLAEIPGFSHILSAMKSQKDGLAAFWADKEYVRVMLREQAMSAGFTIFSEYTARGHDKFFGEERAKVITDLVAGAAITWILVPAPAKSVEKTLTDITWGEWWKSTAATFWPKAKSNFKWGMLIQFPANGTEAFLSNPEEKKGIDRLAYAATAGLKYGLYSGSSMALWANLRYNGLNAYQKLSEDIAKQTNLELARNVLADSVVLASSANQWLGGWTWVRGIKLFHVDKEHPVVEAQDEPFNEEDVQSPSGGSAYLKLHIDEHPVSHLFQSGLK